MAGIWLHLLLFLFGVACGVFAFWIPASGKAAVASLVVPLTGYFLLWAFG